MFAVILTGPPGAGKTRTLTTLSDALVADGIAHAAGDADEIAWAFPFPTTPERVTHLRGWGDSHRRAGHQLLLVAEVVESPAHLDALLDALGAGDHLLAALDAALDTLHARIVAREPPGWPGLDHLLGETAGLQAAVAALPATHARFATDTTATEAIVQQIRALRPDWLGDAGG